MAMDSVMRKELLIEKEWENFNKGGRVNTDIVDPVIVRSWIRSRAYGVDSAKPKIKKLSDYEFEKIKIKNAKLIECVQSIEEELTLSNYFESANIALANQDGVMLYKKNANNTLFITPNEEGNLVSEALIGTAGISTCLAEGKPIKIFGAEHYCKPFHNIFCHASPVFDLNKNILGVLCISTPLKNFGKVLNDTIKIWSMYIEAKLQLTDLTTKYEHTVSLIQEGILILDNDYQIQYINNQAMKILNLDRNPTGSKISDIINMDNEVKAIFHREDVFFKKRITLVSTKRNKRINVFISYSKNNYNGYHHLSITKLNESIEVPASDHPAKYTFNDIVCNSQSIRKAVFIAEKAAQSDATVLLCGESGTGKEVFAQAIHNASERADKPFVAINCGALPHELVQSILFGYEPSSFTGASRHGQAGKFEIASGGTLFLDEIGEMPLDIQVSLLRVLQDKKVVRLGGHNPRSVDVRIIAATNKDLRQEVRLGNFREDLFYRLNVVSITLPALRERIDDIPFLIDFILSQRKPESALSSKSFSYKAMQLMRAYRWPGNIRQLGNFIERLCITACGNSVSDEDVLSLLEINPGVLDPASMGEREMLCEKIKEYAGNIKRIAEDIGCSRSTIYYKIHQYNIDVQKMRKDTSTCDHD